jgi:phage tail-like protein
MPQFTVNPKRVDPYKGFKFRIMWDGRYVAGVSEVGALRRRTEVIAHREGGDASTSHKAPGRTEYEPITLRRGVTHDDEFEDWADKVWRLDAGPDAEVSLADFRKDVTIDLFNEAGQRVLSYHAYRCWVSEYEALPMLVADGCAVAIESITLQNEGWERDRTVGEPVEPTVGES